MFDVKLGHMDPNCLFCKIVLGQTAYYPIAWNNDFLAFLEHKPVAEAHIIAITKRHYPNIVDTPNGMAVSFAKFWTEVGRRAIQRRGGASLYKLQTISFTDQVHHTHIHLIPVSERNEKFFRNTYYEIMKNPDRPQENYQRLTDLCNRYKIGQLPL